MILSFTIVVGLYLALAWFYWNAFLILNLVVIAIGLPLLYRRDRPRDKQRWVQEMFLGEYVVEALRGPRE